MEDKRRLAFAILEFFDECIKDKTIKEDDMASLKVASECISEVFKVDLNNVEQQAFSTKPKSLLNIFVDYLNTQQTDEASKKRKIEDNFTQAEKLRLQGNKKMISKDFHEAIRLYSEAIKLNPENAAYYSNRSAAYSQIEEYNNAIADAEKALEIDPSFSKAYSRLGLAYFKLELYENALEAYTRGLELDPNNVVMKESLVMTKERLQVCHDVNDSSEENENEADHEAEDSDEEGFQRMMNAMGDIFAERILEDPELHSLAYQWVSEGSRLDSREELKNDSYIMEMAKELAQDPQVREA
jgi:small glutamine-rich tetratricopeptide repeat-containing protein alpha